MVMYRQGAADGAGHASQPRWACAKRLSRRALRYTRRMTATSWHGAAARTASDERLVEVIRAEIARDGRLTFARFMELALYHPELGYYLGAELRAGKQGDFLTAPELSPLFGRVVARQLLQVWEALGEPAEFVVTEYGAGRGRLAHAIFEAARDESPRFGAALRYVLHEVNPHRRADAGALLRAAGVEERCAYEWPDGAPAYSAPVVGAVVANEFIDALPVHRAVWRQGALRERYVTWSAGWFAEEEDAPSTPALSAHIVDAGVTLEEGQQVDLILGTAPWLEAAAARLARGVVLAIDYGYSSADLYAPRRRAGSFLCYHQHSSSDEPYTRIGRQDMTAHVDFGLLRRAGERLNLALLGETTQSHFLIDLGLGELLVARQAPGRDLASYLADRTAVATLIDPRGMGSFRVQLQGKRVVLDAPRGFASSSRA